MTNQDLIEIGFKKIPHFTIGNAVICDLGRRRYLSASCVGTANEILFICERDHYDHTLVTDTIVLHNWDYDGELKIEKVKILMEQLKTKEE